MSLIKSISGAVAAGCISAVLALVTNLVIAWNTHQMQATLNRWRAAVTAQHNGCINSAHRNLT